MLNLKNFLIQEGLKCDLFKEKKKRVSSSFKKQHSLGLQNYFRTNHETSGILLFREMRPKQKGLATMISRVYCKTTQTQMLPEFGE